MYTHDIQFLLAKDTRSWANRSHLRQLTPLDTWPGATWRPLRDTAKTTTGWKWLGGLERWAPAGGNMMENGRTLNLEDFIVVCGKNIFKLCNIRNIRITRSQSYGLIFLVPGRGNETGKMGPMGRHGGNVSNVSNATESPWPEAIMAIMAIMGRVGRWGEFCRSCRSRSCRTTFRRSLPLILRQGNALPFVHYNGCTMAAPWHSKNRGWSLGNFYWALVSEVAIVLSTRIPALFALLVWTVWTSTQPV